MRKGIFGSGLARAAFLRTTVRSEASILPRVPRQHFRSLLSSHFCSSSSSGSENPYAGEVSNAPSSSSSKSSSPSYVEVERDIGQLQSRVREAYSSGKYAEAKKYAEACKGLVERHFGCKHPVFASCENNLALVAKATGDLGGAIDCFESAARVYLGTVGKVRLGSRWSFLWRTTPGLFNL